MVIHDVGKVVGGKFICPFPKHLVVKRVGIDLYVPSDEVVHLHDPVFGHFEPDGPVCMRIQQRPPFAFRHGKGVTQGFSCDMIVYEGLFLRLHFRPFGCELLCCVERIVCEPLFYQVLGVFPVYTSAL